MPAIRSPEVRPHTLMVTDSGLGGLSVVADLVRRLRAHRPVPSARVVYVNALADLSMGYQQMPSTAAKVAVFDRALRAMGALQPDHLLIACNTLSVIADRTSFVRQGTIPVTGIVDAALHAMRAHLATRSEAGVAIFGTPTTIASGLYPARLQADGIGPSRIAAEACPDLHLRIEFELDRPGTAQAIHDHVGAALARLPEEVRPHTAASLNCTHYGYAASHFADALRAHGVAEPVVLNPNTAMNDPFVAGAPVADTCEVTVALRSQVPLDPGQKATMQPLLAAASPQVAEALDRWQVQPLFAWRDVVAGG